MVIRAFTLEYRSPGRGLHELTREVEERVADCGVTVGVCHLLVRHTSASLLVQENADPSARHDLERWFERIAPDGDPVWTHRAEGPDDMPAHVRAALTAVSLSLPIHGGRLALGTWQGIFLFEHRHRSHQRVIAGTVLGE